MILIINKVEICGVNTANIKVLTNEELAEIQAKKGKKKNDYNLN